MLRNPHVLRVLSFFGPSDGPESNRRGCARRRTFLRPRRGVVESVHALVPARSAQGVCAFGHPHSTDSLGRPVVGRRLCLSAQLVRGLLLHSRRTTHLTTRRPRL